MATNTPSYAELEETKKSIQDVYNDGQPLDLADDLGPVLESYKNDSDIKTYLKSKYNFAKYWLPQYIDQDRFLSLQKWQCYVIEIRRDTFLARACNLIDEMIEDEDVEFFTNDISDSDKELLKPGAIFYWNVGYFIRTDGQKMRGHKIKFKREPRWSKSEIDNAKIEGKKLKSSLKIE